MTHRAGRARAVVIQCLAAMLALAAPDAFAQRVLLSPLPSATTAQGTQAWDVATRTLMWQIPVGFGDSGTVVTSDGRFVVSRPSVTDAAVLRVLDTETGAFLDVLTDFRPSIAHPRAVAIFGLSAYQTLPSGSVTGTVTRLDFAGLHTFDLCPNRTARGVRLTLDGATLLARCESGEFVLADSGTGAVTRRVSLPAGALSFSATADGSAVYLLATDADAPLELYDTITGALLDSITTPPFCNSSLAGASNDRTRLKVSCSDRLGVPSNPTRTLYLYDTVARRFDVVGGGSNPGIVGLSPDNATLHVRDFSVGRFGRPPSGYLGEVNLTSSSTTWSLSFIGESAVSYPPLAPSLQSMGTGRQVDLSWTLPGHSPAVTRYVLEIGAAPGQSNLGSIDLGAATSFTAGGVPPGTYYVRLRGVNYGGTGAASNELRIDVP